MDLYGILVSQGNVLQIVNQVEGAIAPEVPQNYGGSSLPNETLQRMDLEVAVQQSSDGEEMDTVRT